jgi:hypothetical protein
MSTDVPATVLIPIHHAPQRAPRAQRGKDKRRRTCPRAVRTVAFKEVADSRITCGE